MKRVLFLMTITVMVSIFLDSCYYDNGDELGRACDTTTVKYSDEIRSMIDLNCIECHGAGGTANPKLDSYDEVLIQAENGAFLGVIKHDPGFSPMPQNRPQLDPCQIRQVEIWIDDGAPNN